MSNCHEILLSVTFRRGVSPRFAERSASPRISDAPEEVNCQPDTQLVRCLVNHRKSTEVGISRSNFGVVVGVAAQPP